MEYSINELAKLSGVTSRTLRYYDEIGLLKPHSYSASGYRIYTEQEIDRLQHILFYRELEVPLDQIKALLDHSDFDSSEVLEKHAKALEKKRDRLDSVLETLHKTILSRKEGNVMSANEKFEGFKKQLIDTNEEMYGEEIRSRYGEDIVDKSNAKMMGLTEEAYEEMRKTEEQMLLKLKEAMKSGNPSSLEAREAAQLHKKWLSYTWPTYSVDAHRGLVEMYTADERFTAYYDQHEKGAAEFLKKAVYAMTE